MRTRFGKTIFGLSETGWKLLEMTVVGVNHGVRPKNREGGRLRRLPRQTRSHVRCRLSDTRSTI